MNLRSVLGLAIPLMVAAGCSSDDTTPDPGTTPEAGAQEAAPRAEAAVNDVAAQPDRSVQAEAGQTETGAQPEAASPSGDATVADREAGLAVGDASLPLVDGSADVGAEAAPAPMCGPFADGGTFPDAGAVVALVDAALDSGPAPAANASFFVSSQTNATGNLGGLVGADQRCQTLAAAVGLGGKTWHAYLSVEHDPARANAATNARDRIGAGPWFNVRGVQVAADLTSLHSRKGDASVFLDEHGRLINGQWTGSPAPTEHDVLTGSNPDGTVAVGKTCVDWTSASPVPDGGAPDGGSLFVARVGHTDGYGPLCSTATAPNDVTSWNSAHDNAGCDNTAPRGGAGRIYCFAIN